MTADDAFDKLMHKNALNIPVANPYADSAPAAESVRSAQPVSDEEEALRVMSLLDQVPGGGDYHPQGYDDENGHGIYATPTETDLDPVTDDVVNASRAGARVLGRDAEASEFLAGLAADTGARTVEVIEDPLDSDDPGLDRARRLRRFAYLPVANMDHFEQRARDIMASLSSQSPDRPSLAITSPSRGDGQTEIAIRLALAVAKRVDYRVLLADFDVRKPQVAPRLGLSSKYFALADVLRSSCLLGEALMYSEEDNLYVLPARASDRDGDEVLDDRQVQTLLTQMHATFDFTIIGCGPMDHADATIICRHSGATALAGFCGATRARSLQDAAERLMESGVNVAGLLLTGAHGK